MNDGTEVQVDALHAAVRRLVEAPPDGASAALVATLAAALEASPSTAHLFYEAFRQAPIAISITDADAHILYVNPAFEEVTGYTHGEVVGQRPALLSARETPVEKYRELWSTITAGRTWRGALINRRKGGERYLAELVIAPVSVPDGARHYLGLHRDVTSLHRLEQELRNQKALIEEVVDAVPAVIALVDRERRVLLDNHAYKKLLGDMHPAEPVDHFLDAAGLDAKDFAEAYASQRGFDPREMRIDLGHGREPRWFLVSGYWIDKLDPSAEHYFDAQQSRVLLLVGREITDVKREQERARMHSVRARMAEASLAHGMRETVAGAIFQLQQPLNVAASVRRVMALRGAAEEAVTAVMDEFIAAAEAAVERLQEGLPGKASEPFTPVNLNQLLVDALQMSTERFLSKGITVDWQPTAVLPSIAGQEQRLRLALHQLLENAVIAMSGRGWARRELMLRTRFRNESIELSVADTGPGIPQQARHRVFEPFYTAWANGHPGQGMGLSLIRDVLTSHGGGIEIGDAGGGGCQVTLYLPVARGLES